MLTLFPTRPSRPMVSYHNVVTPPPTPCAGTCTCRWVYAYSHEAERWTVRRMCGSAVVVLTPCEPLVSSEGARQAADFFHAADTMRLLNRIYGTE